MSPTRGAGSQEAPFLGYIDLDIGFPCVEAGTDKVFSTLVLVVLDNSYNQRVPLILGTKAEQWKGDYQ